MKTLLAIFTLFILVVSMSPASAEDALAVASPQAPAWIANTQLAEAPAVAINIQTPAPAVAIDIQTPAPAQKWYTATAVRPYEYKYINKDTASAAPRPVFNFVRLSDGSFASAVPEPSGILGLAAPSFASLLYWRRRRIQV
jgi:hypothetical protein